MEKKIAPCSLRTDTARDVSFAKATNTRNITLKRTGRQSGMNRLHITFLMCVHGWTEAQAHALAVLIWGAC